MTAIEHKSILQAPLLGISQSLLRKPIPFYAIYTVFAPLFIGICSWIRIPLYGSPVPITGQTFGVMLIGALLGSRGGAIAVLSYLFQGCIGFPVWAGGSSGAHHLIGPCGGYFAGFVVQAYLVGWILERQQQFSTVKTISALLLSCCLQLALGMAWLSLYVGVQHSFSMGALPFIPGEIIKICIVTALLKYREKISHI